MKYYFKASEAETSLENIFQEIQKEISTSAVTANASSVLKDTLSEYFVFRDDAIDDSGLITDKVTVRKVSVTGKDEEGNYTWDDENSQRVSNTSNITKKDGKIEVYGFDYSAYAVTQKADGTYTGYKLVLTFPIQPNPDADWEKGTHNYPTNRTDEGSKAGLYGAKVGNEEYDELLEESPQVPVTAYGVTYDANGGENAPTDEKGYLFGTEATVKDSSGVTRSGYTFDGWMDGNEKKWTAGQDITMTGDVTLTAQWLKNPTTYVRLTYNSNYGGTATEEETSAQDWETGTVVTAANAKTVDECGFEKSGFVFKGWSLDTAGTQMLKDNPLTMDANKNLYAIWEKQSTDGVSITKTIMGSEKVYRNGEKVTFEIKIKNTGDETLYDLMLKETKHDGLKPVDHPWTFSMQIDDEMQWLKPKTTGTDTAEENTALTEEPVAVEKPATEELVAEENIIEAAENPLETLAETYSNLAYLMKDEEGNTVVCIPELVPNDEYVLFYTVTVDIQSEDYKKADYTNIAIVDGEESNKETVPVTGIDITKAVVGNTTVKRGDWVLYKIVMKNIGEFDLTGVKITETPDAKLVDGYFCDKDGKVLTDNNVNGNEYTIASLAKDATETLYYTAEVSDNAVNGEKLGNHVVVEATCDGDKVRDERDSEKVTVNVPGNNSSGGGSHRRHSSTKVEEVLNKEDHFQYVQGYPDATVRPDANITRAEATVIFFRLLTDSVREKYLDTENSFTDVSAADWFNLGISTMENGGFVNGYKDGSFRPNGYITRAELATIISNFDDLEPVEESKFPDAAGHWAEAYINSAAEKGWLSGYADGLFRPNQLITRAETMSMINRVLERSVDADGLHQDAKQWQDNPIGKWYYYAVLEATNPHEYERKDTADVERWTAITAEKIWEN